MWPDRVSNPGPLTYESGALPTALRGPVYCTQKGQNYIQFGLSECNRVKTLGLLSPSVDHSLCVINGQDVMYKISEFYRVKRILCIVT